MTVLIDIDSNDILEEFRLGKILVNNATNPAPTKIAKSSDSITIPKAVLILVFLSKIISYY